MNFSKIFVDASAWIANSSADDLDHKRIKKFFSEAISSGATFFTSNDVIDEAVTRLIYDVGLRKATVFYEDFVAALDKKVVTQFWTDERIQEEAFGVLRKFSDQKLSMTDATTVAIMRRFNLDVVLTLDSDFKKIGIVSLP